MEHSGTEKADARPQLADLDVGFGFEGLACRDGVDCDMFSDDEEDFEMMHESKPDSPEDFFDNVISCIEDIMMESGFEVAISSFCRSKCNVFDDNDENKLEYMTVFRDYVGLIEESLDRELEARIKDFTMTRFLQELGQRSPDDLDGEVFEMLLTVTDFESFKAQMLSYKTESELAGLMPRVTSVQVHSNEQEAGDVRPDLDRSLCVSPVKATCH